MKHVVRNIILIGFMMAALNPFDSGAAPAQSGRKSAPAQIPEAPSRPPELTVKQAVDPFRCERNFVYNGETIPCDSIIRQDGERLRPIIRDVPAAIAELDSYQRHRRNIRSAAYVGSFGLVLMVAGSLLGENGGASAKNLLFYSGLTCTAGTVLYGISSLQNNETHLGNAVRLYNEYRPERPIELQFSTELKF